VVTGVLLFPQQEDMLQEHLCKLRRYCGTHMKYVEHGKVLPVDSEPVCAATQWLDYHTPEEQ
jgi:hypothetical protein